MLVNNIQNGGLICEVGEKVIIADITKEIGMHQICPAAYQAISHIMPWFMNADPEEDSLYYSDAAKNGHLCKISLVDMMQVTLITERICLLQKYKDTLYYVSEKTGHLYSYSLQERVARKLIDDEIVVFTISDEHIWYVNEKGIYATDLQGRSRQKISNNSAIRLIYSKDKLFFIDKQQDYAVSYMDISTSRIQTIEDSMASNINIHHDYIFYNHAKDKSHLYRYSIENEFNIKFIPERADYIHIINDTMYYFNQDKKEWMKVPIQGGKPLRLIE